MTADQRDNFHVIWTMIRANGGSTRLDGLRAAARAFERRGLLAREPGAGLARWRATAEGDRLGAEIAAERAARREAVRAATRAAARA